MSKQRWKTACVTVGMVAIPAIAHAQLQAPREAAQISYGPVSLYPALQILDAGKDSNVFNEATNPKEDYTLTVASRILVVTRLGLNELMVSTGSDYVWFQQYKSERSNNALYAVRFNLSASRFKPFVGAERARTRTRPSSEIDTRTRRWVDRVLAGANFSLTERTAITMSAEENHSTYDDGETFRGVDLPLSLDTTGHLYSGGVKYQITPLTAIRIEGSYQQDIFPKSHVRDAKTYAVAPTVEFSPDAAIRGTFSAGVEVFKPDDPQLVEYRGPTYTGGVEFSPFSRTTIDVHAARNVSYSYHEDEPYYLLTRTAVGVSQRVIGPVGVTGGVERQFLSYRWRRGLISGLESEVAAAPRRDTSDLFSGGVTVALPRGFRLALTAEHTRRRSKVDDLLNYRRTRLLSTFTIGS